LKAEPDAEAAMKVLYLVIRNHQPNRTNATGKTAGKRNARPISTRRASG
jgi:hypothetical protein